jgi:hypothetical protein
LSVQRTLQDLRQGLLELHKALIVAEQITYERIHGRVPSNGQLLQLALHDPWFTWLLPFCDALVQLDQLLDGTGETTVAQAELLVEEVRTLIQPSEEGDGFARSYYEALQRAPDVALCHCQVKKLLMAVAA